MYGGKGTCSWLYIQDKISLWILVKLDKGIAITRASQIVLLWNRCCTIRYSGSPWIFYGMKLLRITSEALSAIVQNPNQIGMICWSAQQNTLWIMYDRFGVYFAVSRWEESCSIHHYNISSSDHWRNRQGVWSSAHQPNIYCGGDDKGRCFHILLQRGY